MRIQMLSTVLLLAVLTSACTTIPDAPVQTPTVAHKDHDHERPVPPAVPKHGERVTEDQLPAELAAWKEYKPYSAGPGGTSAVVGDMLYILASPGIIHDDAQEFKVGDIQVKSGYVEVEAYLIHALRPYTNSVITTYKDYVKIPYSGGTDLPVKMKMIYDSAAYAYIAGEFDRVEPGLLPRTLHAWQEDSAAGLGHQAVKVGDYLYFLVNVAEMMQEDTGIGITNLELKDGIALVEVTSYPLPAAYPQLNPPSVMFARIPYQEDSIPKVERIMKKG